MGVRSKTVADRTGATRPAPTARREYGQPVAPRASGSFAAEIEELPRLDPAQLRLRWRNHLGGSFPAHLPKWLLVRLLAYRLQAAALGGLDPEIQRKIRGPGSEAEGDPAARFAPRVPATKDGVKLRSGALLVREWKGQLQRVMILEKGFAWNGETYSSLSKVATAITGVNWNGHRFFGLKKVGSDRVGSNPDAA